jgi:ABC-type lipoprotein export system ATPase subunit
MIKNILEIKNIKKIFKHRNGNINLFKNISLNIKTGDLVALTGPSGSGKSSLLHILGLLDKPTSGNISFMNKNFKNLNEGQKDKIRQLHISIIFQDNNLLSDFTVLENVLMPLIIRDLNFSRSKEKAIKSIKEVGLLDRIHHFPNELSGGEQQRVAIARALISDTNLILADEPTGNLDFKTSQSIFSYFLKLKKLNKTIIFATHNRELANKADYKLCILNGNIKRANVIK